jgi:hypothetical protein
MKVLWRRGALAAALSLTAAVGGLLVAGTAHAQKVTSGTLSFSGDDGDYISQGDSWSYATSKGDALNVSSSSGSTVSISVNAYNGDWWTLTFDAPGTQVLTARTYSAAHRHPFNGTGPGLDLSGEGRGCNELTGSFTVTKAVFGRDGYVQAFDATFEQHCEGGTAAARGRVHIANSPQPRASSSKPTTTTRSPGATAKPRATPTKPRATPATPRPTPASTPSAPAAVAGGQNPPADDAETYALAAATLERKAALAQLLRNGLGLVALIGVVALAGLLTVGVVMHLRGR